MAALADGIAASGTGLKAALVACTLAVIALVVALLVVPAPARTGTTTTAGRAPGGSAGGPSQSPAAATSPAPTTAAPTTAAPTTAGPATAAPTTAAPATVAPATAAGGAPVVTAISPDAGRPGQRVTIRGANLASANGTITVMFGTVQAGVACPSRTECVAVVPPQPGGLPHDHRVAVTLATTGGTTKPLPFKYH